MSEGGAAGAAENVLVACVRQGDRNAAALLMQRHNRGLWRIARGILGNEADAEEVVQEAYVRAFASLHEFRGDASLSTWLARIVINEALRHLSRRRPMSDLAAVDENAADHLRIEMPPPSSEAEGRDWHPVPPEARAAFPPTAEILQRKLVRLPLAS
jgi:RNA polymerase sigma-70 factor (ECF subfamily)